MCADEHGLAGLAHLLDHELQFLDRVRVEAEERLVHEEDVGVRQEADAEVEFLLHAFAELVAEFLLLIGELEALKEHVDALLVVGHFVSAGDELHVLDDGERRVKRRELGDVAHDLSGLGGLVRDAVDRDAAVVLEKADDRLDDGALTGAVRAEEDREAPVLEQERHVVAREVFAVLLGHMIYV